MSDGRLLQVSVSAGGVPKRPVAEARVRRLGVDGDHQREVTVHGGPLRAVSLLGIEAIHRIADEGHPIAPGTTGENLTTEGFDISALPPGTRLAIGSEVVIELSGPANPCRTIRHSFSDLRFGRLGIAAHPRDSRMYARVLREGVVRPGDPIDLLPPADDAAERYAIAGRLDRAVRSAFVSLWTAAIAGGADVAVVDEGELAIAASPSLPGRTLNQGIGFAHLPQLAYRGVDHFRAHRSTGWVWAEEQPWPGAQHDGEVVHAAAPVAELTTSPAPAELVVRELGRDEIGAWAEVMIDANGMSGRFADAWRAMERHLALAAHDHRYLGEVEGHPVAAGAIHTHHRVGYLRAGSVLPEFRGRGIQRAMIEMRARHAANLGCELVGSIAEAGSSSARNLERAGLRVVAVRRAYRVDLAD